MHILLRVHDLDLFPQLGNDGARSPAVFKCEILHVKKKKKKSSSFIDQSVDFYSRYE